MTAKASVPVVAVLLATALVLTACGGGGGGGPAGSDAPGPVSGTVAGRP